MEMMTPYRLRKVRAILGDGVNVANSQRALTYIQGVYEKLGGCKDPSLLDMRSAFHHAALQHITRTPRTPSPELIVDGVLLRFFMGKTDKKGLCDELSRVLGKDLLYRTLRNCEAAATLRRLTASK